MCVFSMLFFRVFKLWWSWFIGVKMMRWDVYKKISDVVMVSFINVSCMVDSSEF